MSVGLALVVRIHEAYGSIEEDEIHNQDEAQDDKDSAAALDRPAGQS